MNRPRMDAEVLLTPFRVHGFLPVLILLSIFFVLTPIFEEAAPTRVMLSILFYLAMMAAIQASGANRPALLAAYPVAFLALGMKAFDQTLNVPALGAAEDVVASVFLVATATAVLVHVLRDQKVTLNTVFGAVCVYHDWPVLGARVFPD